MISTYYQASGWRATLPSVGGSRLVGLKEVAELLQVPRNSAWRYSRREDFPRPVARPASGPVWEERDVRRWADKSLPLPVGRPRRTQGEND